MRTFVLAVIVTTFVLAHAHSADARGRRQKRRHGSAHAGKKVSPGTEAVVPAPPTRDVESADSTDEEPGSATSAAVEDKKGGKKRVQVLDFEGFGVEGRLRTPQLLYFLARVREELARASLENRSFMPELQRTVKEGSF